MQRCGSLSSPLQAGWLNSVIEGLAQYKILTVTYVRSEQNIADKHSRGEHLLQPTSSTLDRESGNTTTTTKEKETKNQTSEQALSVDASNLPAPQNMRTWFELLERLRRLKSINLS